MITKIQRTQAKQVAENFEVKCYDKEAAVNYMLELGWQRDLIIEVMVNMAK